MNASTIFKQLMQQDDGEFGVKGVLGEAHRAEEDRLERPSSSKSRRASGFDTRSALGGGVMALLMGSGPGRKLTGKALKYGIVAGAGMYAWNAWQNSELRNGPRASTDAEWDRNEFRGEHIDSLDGERREQRSRALLQAMIMAARASGQNDEQTRASITAKMSELGADDGLYAWVEKQLSAPLDANTLAEQADSPQAAREIYLVSLAVAGEQPSTGDGWLDRLAAALGLERETVAELKRQAGLAG